MKKKPLEIIAGAPDKPLVIAGIAIPCYVLEGETRVLIQRGLQTAIGMSTSGGSSGAHRLAQFLGSIAEKGINCNELVLRTRKPILFHSPLGGRIAYGYSATIINDICDAVLEAKEAGLLLKQQEHIAKRCQILVRGLARVGIIALVDEATGYQEIRGQLALAKILERFLEKEYHKWTRTFPIEFYEQIFRLKGWDFETLPDGKKPPTPLVIGKITNKIIYDRLAPGVLDELEKLNPADSSGRRQVRHHQWFNTDCGHPRLKEHIEGVMALLRIAHNWRGFERYLEQAYPKPGDQIEASFDED